MRTAASGQSRWDAWAATVCRIPGWSALLGAAAFMVFTATVLPGQAAISAPYTGEVGAPDTRLWYSADDLYAAAEAFGAAGRASYVVARLTFDVVWPLVYGFFLVSALGWLFGRATEPGSRWRRVTLLPVLTVLLDYAENVCTATVMARYPEPTPVLAQLAPFCTAVKWLTLGAGFALVVGGAVAALVTAVRRR